MDALDDFLQEEGSLAMMHSKGLKRAAITSAEIASRSLDPQDPKTFLLSGLKTSLPQVLRKEERRAVAPAASSSCSLLPQDLKTPRPSYLYAPGTGKPLSRIRASR